MSKQNDGLKKWLARAPPGHCPVCHVRRAVSGKVTCGDSACVKRYFDTYQRAYRAETRHTELQLVTAREPMTGKRGWFVQVLACGCHIPHKRSMAWKRRRAYCVSQHPTVQG